MQFSVIISQNRIIHFIVRQFVKEMLQIVNKDIFLGSFFQKLKRKGKNQSTKISRWLEGRTVSLGNS